MSVVCYSQFWPRLWGWDPRATVHRHIRKVTLALIYGGFMFMFTITTIVLAINSDKTGEGWAWIDVVYGLVYVKLIYTVFKYIPQVVSNFRRRSTIGWSIQVRRSLA